MARVSFKLTLAMVASLKKIVASRFTGAAIKQRAECILLAHEDFTFVAIGRLVGLSPKTTSKWVHRLMDSIDALLAVEKTRVKAALDREILDCLRDAQRLGRPKTFTSTQVAAIVSVGCEDPAKSGRPVTQWTTPEIVSEVILRKIVNSISTSQTQRFLNRADLRPGKNKGWCFTTEKDQQLFTKQVQEVCDTYLDV